MENVRQPQIEATLRVLSRKKLRMCCSFFSVQSSMWFGAELLEDRLAQTIMKQSYFFCSLYRDAEAGNCEKL